MQIRTKLLCLLVLPVAALSIVSGRQLIAEHRAAEHTRDFRALALLSTGISDLVHELQKERGLSNGFVAGKGAKLSQELAAQHQTSDSHISGLFTSLQSFAWSHFDPDLDAQAHRLTQALAALAQHRTEVTALKLTLAQTSAPYTAVIADGIDFVKQLGAERIDPELTPRFQAYTSLMAGKERLGIQRAMLNAAFTADKFAPDAFLKFVAVMSEGDVYLREFEHFAHPELAAEFKTHQSDGPAVEVERLRKLALEKGVEGGFGVDPGAWFAAATHVIDGLHEIEHDEATDLCAAAGLAADAATSRRNVIAATAIGSMLLTLSLGFVVVRSINRPLARMLGTITDMTDGSRDLTQRIDDARRDEFGRLGAAFNRFVDDLNKSTATAREQSERIAADAESLRQKVEQMLVVATAAGRGDLTREVTVHGDDAMGQLADGFRAMIASISTLIRETGLGTDQIDAGARQIAAASQTLASGASEQAASLEQITASIEEITSMTNRNADNAQQASVLSDQARQAANVGEQQTTELSAAMTQIQESADKIGAILKTIDDIAFQTNLLALNAAVEAARAGESGKGFAVVAEEVRNLAQRSAEAARTTASLIHESKQRADTGVSISQRVAGALGGIVEGTQKVNTLLTEIAAASKEQAQGVSQVSRGLTDLDKVTQQTAGNAEELASAAEETAAQVATMREMLARIKVADGASSATSSTSPSPSVAPSRSQTRGLQPPRTEPLRRAELAAF